MAVLTKVLNVHIPWDSNCTSQNPSCTNSRAFKDTYVKTVISFSQQRQKDTALRVAEWLHNLWNIPTVRNRNSTETDTTRKICGSCNRSPAVRWASGWTESRSFNAISPWFPDLLLSLGQHHPQHDKGMVAAIPDYCLEKRREVLPEFFQKQTTADSNSYPQSLLPSSSRSYAHLAFLAASVAM